MWETDSWFLLKERIEYYGEDDLWGWPKDWTEAFLTQIKASILQADGIAWETLWRCDKSR